MQQPDLVLLDLMVRKKRSRGGVSCADSEPGGCADKPDRRIVSV